MLESHRPAPGAAPATAESLSSGSWPEDHPPSIPTTDGNLRRTPPRPTRLAAAGASSDPSRLRPTPHRRGRSRIGDESGFFLAIRVGVENGTGPLPDEAEPLESASHRLVGESPPGAPLQFLLKQRRGPVRMGERNSCGERPIRAGTRDAVNLAKRGDPFRRGVEKRSTCLAYETRACPKYSRFSLSTSTGRVSPFKGNTATATGRSGKGSSGRGFRKGPVGPKGNAGPTG
jgi:hypothetical protein